MIQSSPWILTWCFLLAGEKGESYTQAASKYRGGVSPETLLRVQTRGHGVLALLKFPSLVSLLWVLTTFWSCSPPGSELSSDQSFDVWPELWCVTRPLMDPRGEILEGLDWDRSWCRGDTMGGGGLWVGHVSMSGAVENVSPYMTDLHWFMILFFHSVKQLPCGDWVRQDSISHPCIMTWRSDFSFCRSHLNVFVLLLA